MQRSEGDSGILFFHLGGPREQTQVPPLYSEHLFLQNLPSPVLYILRTRRDGSDLRWRIFKETETIVTLV